MRHECQRNLAADLAAAFATEDTESRLLPHYWMLITGFSLLISGYWILLSPRISRQCNPVGQIVVIIDARIVVEHLCRIVRKAFWQKLP